MKNTIIIILALLGSTLHLQGQKANIFAAFQLIESAKYAEAKKAIDEALEDEKTKKWYKTWYARGLLCQKAYEKGMKDKNQKLYELYPDQLFLSYESFEKALAYKRNSRITDQLEPIYIQLANNFMVLGEKEYKANKYDKSLKAYENALKINESSILSVELDTNLLYNTALAAYNSKQYENSLAYLQRLNEMSYSPNIPHILSTVHLSMGDTSKAETVLREGIELYKNSDDLILLIVELLYDADECNAAVIVLDSATVRSPEKYIFPYTKGLVYQKKERYEEAIEAYKKAIEVDPDKQSAYTNIGTCYFNIGVEREQNARSINNNKSFREELAKSESAKKDAVSWLEMVLVKDPGNETVKNQLIQLYRSLHMTEKIKELTP
jgi:tetratricopeptide (TPR) repeat protein